MGPWTPPPSEWWPYCWTRTAVGSLGCREDICCVCREDICCIKSQDICCSSRKDTRHLNEIDDTLGGRLRRPPQGVVDEIEMSDVAADVAAVAAFLAADTTDVLAADTTDVLSAAKAASGGFCPANNPRYWRVTTPRQPPRYQMCEVLGTRSTP